MTHAETLRGAVYGHLVGDAIGVPYEFSAPDRSRVVEVRGHGAHNQPPGTWSDDGALMLALLDSLLSAGFDPDPYSLWHCDQVSTEERPELFNYIGYCNPEVDEIIEAGLATSDQAERTELYHRFQEILAEEQPYLFAYAPLVRDGMHAGMAFTDGEFNLESPTWLWNRHKIVIPEG